MSNIINIYQTEEYVNIRIKKWDIVELAARHPEWPVKVTHMQKFVDAVVDQMENYDEINEREQGITYLQAALDKFIQAAADDNPEIAEPIDVENQ